MRKPLLSIIGLAISLTSAYLLLERQQEAARKPGTGAASAPAAAQGVAGSATSAPDAPLPGSTLQDDKGNPLDLANLPPEARAALEQQMQAMKSGAGLPGPAGSALPAIGDLPGMPERQASEPAPPSDAGRNAGSSRKFSYRDRNDWQTTSFASGWTVVLERKLSDRYTTLADQVMGELERQLDRAAAALPRAAVEELRKVQIRIAYEDKGPAPVRYHWPDEKDLDPALAGVIEIPGARTFLDASPRRPWLALQELASAWHQRVLGAEHAAVRNAYREALRLGSYKTVKLADGRTGRSMALAGEREFFTELSKAFYGRGDAYPFVREEFLQYDPVSARVIEAAWNRR